jgi:hypothetical protein
VPEKLSGVEIPAAVDEFLPSVTRAVEDERVEVDLVPDLISQDEPRWQARPSTRVVRVAKGCQCRLRALDVFTCHGEINIAVLASLSAKQGIDAYAPSPFDRNDYTGRLEYVDDLKNVIFGHRS